MKTPSKSLLAAGAAGLLLLAGGSWYVLGSSSTPFPVSRMEKLAAGLALPENPSTQISVLNAPVPAESGTPLTQSNQLLPTNTQVSLVGQNHPAAVTPAAVPVFNENAARLGTTLSLLLSTWGQSGALPHQLANTAAQLAEKTGQPALASAAADLRRATPREGPATLSLLLVEMNKALTLKAPANLPATEAEAEAQKSWLLRQLELFVHIGSSSSQTSWENALLTTQQLIARGAVTDAANLLESSPLKDDDRLATLRQQVRTYLLQTGRLTHTITTYANTFLLTEEN